MSIRRYKVIRFMRTDPVQSGQSWLRTARRPIEKLNRVHDRNRCTAGNLHHASDVARSNHVRLDRRDIGELSIAQSRRNIRLEDVVCPRRTATQMTLRYIFHHESALGKQFFRGLCDFLPVLQRAGRMIGDDDVAVTPPLDLQFEA